MALRSSSSNGATGSTAVSVPVPTGVAINDIIILAYTSDTSSVAVTLPTGFTSLVKLNGYGANGQSAEISWKRASAADTGTYSWTNNSLGDWAAQAFAFSGRDQGNPPVNSATSSSNVFNSSPTVLTANGLAVASHDDLLFIGAPDLGNSVTDTMTVQPTGFTTIFASTQFGLSVLGAAEEDNVASSGTVTATATFDAGAGIQSWAAWTIRIPAPAQAGGVTPEFLTHAHHPGGHGVSVLWN